MPSIKVTSEFVDRETRERCTVGATVERSQERCNELIKKGFGQSVKQTTTQPTVNAGATEAPDKPKRGRRKKTQG